MWRKKVMHRSQSLLSLRGRGSADVVIVGGGFTGIASAMLLSRSGMHVAVVEAGRNGSGITSHCGGVAAVIPGMMFSSILEQRGYAAAEALWHTRLSAYQKVRELAMEAAEWQDVGVNIWGRSGRANLLEKEYDVLKRIGAGVECVHHPKEKNGYIRYEHGGMLHSQKYFFFLCNHLRNVDLYEMSRVLSTDDDTVYAEYGSIRAPYIIIATGFPIVNIPGCFFSRMEQRRCLLMHAKAEIDGVDIIEDEVIWSRKKDGNVMVSGKPGTDWTEMRQKAMQTATRCGM